ncbi:SDR family oxidoreductase [Streptomyces sp. NPDC005708]|uniref:SDR family oxidoreductase n=1 Tax=Streptomyces sp. NPDC005708 TaxID=3154564 RepID=UPI0033CAACF2
MSTITAALGFSGMALYGSSKAALNLLTKAWVAEFGPRGVRVNAVQVGPTLTETTAQTKDDLQSLAAQAPAGQPASAKIAVSIAYMADDAASSFVQGTVLPVDSGRTPSDRTPPGLHRREISRWTAVRTRQ